MAVTAAVVLGVAAAAVAVLGGMQRGNIAEANAQYEEIRAKEAAKAVEAEGAVEAEKTFRKVRQQIGLARALTTGQGIDITGTPAFMIEQSLYNTAKDLDQLDIGTRFEARTLRSSAAFSRESGQIEKKAAILGGVGQALGIGGSIASGFAGRGAVPAGGGTTTPPPTIARRSTRTVLAE